MLVTGFEDGINIKGFVSVSTTISSPFSKILLIQEGTLSDSYIYTTEPAMQQTINKVVAINILDQRPQYLLLPRNCDFDMLP
mmetsp:Transcript_19681/g.29810  ORF Transcript_19681/g.29810 Transcript_19681/m.29810 type:complete len:82 (-) Transcript_19681:766-1011(-)